MQNGVRSQNPRWCRMKNNGVISYQQAVELWDYDPATGIITNKTTRAPNCLAGSEAGTLRPDGYRYIKYNGNLFSAHRIAWLLHYTCWPADQIDHANHARDDNAIANLRQVTNRENGRNQSLRADNTSGVAGVCWHQPSKKWRARIRIDGKLKHLGVFGDFGEAVAARKAAEIQYNFHPNHGERNG